MNKSETSRTSEVLEAKLSRYEEIAKKIDPRLRAVNHGPLTLSIEGQEKQIIAYPKICIYLGREFIASFHADEQYTDKEIRGQVVVSLQKINAKYSINL
jgi:hypothetical protein